MTHLTTGALRRNMKDTLLKTSRKGERFIIERRGEPVAALVPIEDLEALEALEDKMDIEEAERILADPNEVPIPYEEVRKRLGLG